MRFALPSAPRRASLVLLAALALPTCRDKAPERPRATQPPPAEPPASAPVSLPPPSPPEAPSPSAVVGQWQRIPRDGPSRASALASPSDAGAPAAPSRALGVASLWDGTTLWFDEVFDDPTHGRVRVQPLDAMGRPRGDARLLLRVSSPVEGFDVDAAANTVWITFARRRVRARSWFAMAVRSNARAMSPIVSLGPEMPMVGDAPGSPGAIARVIARDDGGACVARLDPATQEPAPEGEGYEAHNCQLGMDWRVDCVGPGHALEADRDATVNCLNMDFEMERHPTHEERGDLVALGTWGGTVVVAGLRYDANIESFSEGMMLFEIPLGPDAASERFADLSAWMAGLRPTTMAVVNDTWIEAHLAGLREAPQRPEQRNFVSARLSRGGARNDAGALAEQRSAWIDGVALRCAGPRLRVVPHALQGTAQELVVGAAGTRLRLVDWVRAAMLPDSLRADDLRSAAWTGQRLVVVRGAQTERYACADDGALVRDATPAEVDAGARPSP